MGRWSKAFVASLCGLLVVAISFARVYLGADWLSDILGGLFAAAMLTGIFGMAIEAVPTRRIRPLGLVGFVGVIGILTSQAHINSQHDRALIEFAAIPRAQVYDETTWMADAWRNLPQRRVDVAGQAEEQFVAQWIGPLDKLEGLLKQKGWKSEPVWTWKDSLSYLDTEATLAALSPRPLLHQGLRAKLTMTRAEGEGRDVLRVYRSTAEIQASSARQPVFLVSLTGEVRRQRFMLFAMPGTIVASKDKSAGFLRSLSESSGTKVIAGIPPTHTAPAAVFQASP
jgi:hypothetical protein